MSMQKHAGQANNATNIRLEKTALVRFSGCNRAVGRLRFGAARVRKRRRCKAFRRGRGSADHWLSHGRTWDEQRFSPLDDASTKTVSRLGLSWSLKLSTNRRIESTPIVVDGTMFVTAAWSLVYALDAATGAIFRTYDLNSLSASLSALSALTDEESSPNSAAN